MDEPKTHTLFMGMDFDVQQGKDYHRVTDVVGGSFILRIDGKIVRVSVNEEVGLRITQGLKLATVSAGIKDLKTERAYTPGNDPRRKWMTTMNAMSDGAAHSVQEARRTMDYSTENARLTEEYVEANPRAAEAMAGRLAADQAAATRSQQGFESAAQMSGTMSNSAYYIQKMEEELRQELYDAVDVSFEISSAQPLANPYVVVVVQFHAPNAPKGTAQNWIYAEAIERLDAQPKKFHVKRGGFPSGYEMERFQVHVYDRGREVASTVAPKRVELTTSEAYDYLLIEHLAAHKGKDAAPAVALGNLPVDLRQKLPSGDYGQTYFAKVNQEGWAEGVFTDEKCTKALEENYTASVIRNMRFLPALEKGKPVEGVAKVRMNGITL